MVSFCDAKRGTDFRRQPASDYDGGKLQTREKRPCGEARTNPRRLKCGVKDKQGEEAHYVEVSSQLKKESRMSSPIF